MTIDSDSPSSAVSVLDGSLHGSVTDIHTQGPTVYAQERFSGPFRRVVSLPEDVDPAQVQAAYRDGILRVTIGKRESSKPRRIEVN